MGGVGGGGAVDLFTPSKLRVDLDVFLSQAVAALRAQEDAAVFFYFYF